MEEIVAIVAICLGSVTFCYMINRISHIIKYRIDTKKQQELQLKQNTRLTNDSQDFQAKVEKRLQNLETIIAQDNPEKNIMDQDRANDHIHNFSREKI